MGGWESGKGMINQPELEEGEACYYKDDTSIDPDIALSYIGDKVQNILGHLQKDFEGGVSAENLGAKFGGYGSFLPMYQRSPSIWLQPKSPLRVLNPSLSRSPNHPFPEGPAPNSVIVPDAPPTQRNCSASPPSMCRPSRNLKFTSEDASIKQKTSLSSDQVAEPGKVELPSNKSGNLTDQRMLKVRIKVGSERMAQYNAEIYNLGLTSPSSSAGNSPDETPNESPANILQIMTSFPMSGDLLLSPLCEGLLNLVRETESSIESEHEAARKSYSVSVKLLNNDVLGGKKTKSIKKRENFEKSENECMVGLDDRKQKNSESETLESRVQPSHDLYFKPLSDTVREVKDVQVKKRKGSKDGVKGRVVSGDLVKDASVERISPHSRGKHEQQGSRSSSVEKLGEHRARISQKDFSVDHGHGSKISGNKDRASFQAYLNISEGERIKVAMDNSSLKVGMKATSGEQYGLGMTHAVNKLSFEGEKKSKGCQSSGKLASKLAESLTGGGSAVPKNKYSGKKDVHSGHLSQKDVVDTSLEHLENPKQLGRPSGDRPKNSNLEAAKAKLAYDDKLKESSSNKKYFDKMTSETYLIEPPLAVIPSNQGIITGSEPTVVAPVVIQEDWVGCDRCQKWRLLPYGTKSEQLPDKWVCSMLDWLPGMNRCDISEDETTSAVRASYLLPVPENQYNFQAPADKTLPGVSLASAHHLDQNCQNFASDQIADQVRKQKQKEKLNTVSMSNAGPSDGKKNLQQWAVKNGSSKEVNQSVAGVNAANKSIAQHPNKSAVVVAKLNKRKEGHGTGDDANPRKKSKKESVRVEKIKSKGALNVDNCQTSGGNLGGIGHCLTSGLPNKAAVRGGNEQSAQKDAIPGGMGNFQIHVKKKKDRIQDLPNYEHTGMKTCNGREVSAKNRKFKDCEDSQHQVETGQDNGSNLQDSKVTMKEGSKDSAFQRHKKSRVTQIEEEFNGCKGDDTSKRKGAEASFLLLRSKEYPINRGIEREQQLRRPRVKPRLTIEDIDKLRKDLGCEQLSTAATSSSSKVSDSCKNRTSFMEVKGSPQESVSSSPVRTTYRNQVSPMTMETVGKVDSRLNDPAMGSLKKFSDMNRSSELLTTRKQKASGVYCPEPFENPVLDFQEGDARDKSSGELVSGVNLPSDFVNSPLVGIEDNILEKCSPWPTRVRVVSRSHNKQGTSKDQSNTKLPQRNARKNSSLRSMGKNRTSGYAFERVAENPSTDSEVVNSKNKWKEETDVNNNYHAPQYEVLSNVKHPLSDESSIISVKNNLSVGNRDLGKRGDNRSETQSTATERDRNGVKSSAPCRADAIQQNLNQDFVRSSVEQTSAQMEPRSGKLLINLRQGDKQGALCSSKHALGLSVSLKKTVMNSRPLDDSVAGTSKALKDAAIACPRNWTDNFNGHNEVEQSVAVDESLANKNVSSASASTALKEAEDVLKEAEELRIHADLIKNSGFGSESNYEYFKAALKFLHGASLLEACNGESSKQWEMNPMQMYRAAAKLCKTCAYEYEKDCEMAAAALVYKCMEVAYLRVVYCKSTTTSRVWHDLQSSLQMLPQGESPSSSASDVDNLNNLATADKATLSKGNDHAGNHVMVPHNCPNFVPLLDFTKDVNSAMEAAKKSHDTLAAAHVKLEESQNKEGIVPVKRAIDFSFQDVEELIRLVWLAFNTIFHQGLGGRRE